MAEVAGFSLVCHGQPLSAWRTAVTRSLISIASSRSPSAARQASNGCRQVTELVPSGLAPVGPGSRWADPESEDNLDPGVVLPYDQSGSRVRFCIAPIDAGYPFLIR